MHCEGLLRQEVGCLGSDRAAKIDFIRHYRLRRIFKMQFGARFRI
jgi:hypothetical protein